LADAADLPTKATPAPLAAAPFFLFSDTQISLWDMPKAAEPELGHINKGILSLTHVDAWQYGTNFVNIDFLKSDDHDPAAPWGAPGTPFATIPVSGVGDGAFEVYGLFRSTLSFNALTDSKKFSFGPLKDISLYYGGDTNTKNTALAPRKRDVVGGIQFAFNLPGGGSLNVAPVYYKEWVHNGIAVDLIAIGQCSSAVCTENVSFASTGAVETSYMVLLSFLGPVRFQGFANVIAPKGKDGFGNQTKTEFRTDNKLILDVGQLVANKPHWIDAFVGYSYWQNAHGNDHTTDPTGGSTQNTVFFGMSWHAL
jgi:hypothetical protein